ncbi:MAG: SH3 domain-containing protein [Anaerolineae bacterium]|nr:SH3 domain-containing protein [Anaerolineae bacterium]
MSKRNAIIVFFALALVLLSLPALQVNADFGTNWTATYYNCTDFNCSAVATQTGVNGINFNWGTSSPFQGVNSDNFTVRFESVQTFQQGTYEFVAASDDGIRVYIDGALVLDKFIGRVFTTDRFQQTLTAGAHTLRVEFLELIDQAQVQFQYFFVSGSPIGVPTSPVTGLLPTPTITAIPPTPLPPIPPGAQTATVIRASVLNVRAAPYLGAPRVGRVLRGQTYAVVGRDADARWFLLQLSGGQAWAWGYYLFVSGNEFTAPVVANFALSGDPAASARVTVQTQAGLRLRAAPTVLSEQIGRVPWGDLLPVIGKTRAGDWYQVVFRGTVGWIASGYVDILEGEINEVPVTG